MFSSLRRLFVRVRIQPGRRVRQIPAVRPALDRLEERLAPAASPFAIGSPAGSAPLIRLFDSDTGAQIDQIRPFQPSYTGGINVTLADLDRDGAPEIIASAASGSPHVVVFDGATHAVTASFLAFPGSTSGVSIAAGDIGNGSRGIVVGYGIEPNFLTYLEDIRMSWFRTSPSRSSDIQCPRCECSVVGCLPSGDHHLSSCPHCEAKLIVFSMTAKNVAIDVDRSPREIQSVFQWMQQHFDELEFVSVITAVEELCEPAG